MAFILKQSDSYTWPVTIEQPAKSGGRIDKHVFDVEFHRLPQSRINELVDGAREGTFKDRDVCREIVAGWTGISDGEQDVPFSLSALEQLLDENGAERGILGAWFDSLSGAKRKN